MVTEETNVASAWMECRRFVMRRLERFSSDRMVLRSFVWEGKMMVFPWEVILCKSVLAHPLLGGRLNASEVKWSEVKVQ